MHAGMYAYMYTCSNGVTICKHAFRNTCMVMCIMLASGIGWYDFMSMGMSCLSVSLKVVLWPTNIEVWIEDGFSRLPGHRLSPLHADYAVASVRASLNAVIWPSPLYVYLCLFVYVSVCLCPSLWVSSFLCNTYVFSQWFLYKQAYWFTHM